jgi:hypothetical protein
MPTISWSGSTSSPRREAKFVAVAIVSVSDTSMMPTAPIRSGPTSDHFIHGSAGTGTPLGQSTDSLPPARPVPLDLRSHRRHRGDVRRGSRTGRGTCARRGWHRQHTGTGSIWQRQSWYAHSTAAELQRARLTMTCAPFIDVEGSGRVHANARPGARARNEPDRARTSPRRPPATSSNPPHREVPDCAVWSIYGAHSRPAVSDSGFV